MSTQHMGDSGRQRSVPVVVLLGAASTFIGIIFAIPTGPAKLWRLSAWVISAFAFAAHIGYERFRRRNPPVLGALHVALAVALGAFGLAISANIHSLRLGSA